VSLTLRRDLSRAALTGLGLLGLLGSAFGQGEDRSAAAKVLFFDHKYGEARDIWQSMRGAGGASLYWVARCSENLGDRERALKEYGEYLDTKQPEPTLAEEAKTARIGIAAHLYKTGQRQHLPILRQGLSDPNKTVRYYAALKLAELDPAVAQPAIPVLQTIILEEKDEDLVSRAKLKLLRLDPETLNKIARESELRQPRPRPNPSPSSPWKEATWLKVRISSPGRSEPEVSLNLPVALAELVFQSLPENAKRNLQERGYAGPNFWEKLKKLGPTQILDIHGDKGERIQIWIE